MPAPVCDDIAAHTFSFLPLREARTAREYRWWCRTRSRRVVVDSLRELAAHAIDEDETWEKMTWAVDKYGVTAEEAAKHKLVRYDELCCYTTLSLIERFDPAYASTDAREWWERSYPD